MGRKRLTLEDRKRRVVEFATKVVKENLKADVEEINTVLDKHMRYAPKVKSYLNRLVLRGQKKGRSL